MRKFSSVISILFVSLMCTFARADSTPKPSASPAKKIVHASSPIAVVTGVLVAYDAKTATLETKTGKIKVPRSSVDKIQSQTIGKSKVTARMTVDQLEKANAK